VIITPTFTARFDSNFGSNSMAARDAWSAAAQLFTSAFSDDIHINITVDAVTDPKVLGESFPQLVSIPYSEMYARVNAYASTQNDLIAVGPGGSVIASDPTNGGGSWSLTRAQAKGLGYIPDDLSDDGGTTFGTSQSYTFAGSIAAGTIDFVGVAAHEISEIMGRAGLSGGHNSFSLIDLFSFTGAGTRGLQGGPGNFFSIDNGSTLIKAFNDTRFGGDSRDWAGGTNDAFNATASFSVRSIVSAVDFQLMDVLGYGKINPLGSLVQTSGHVTFLRAHELGTGFGSPPNFLDAEIVVQLAEEPARSFGFQLRNDNNAASHQAMFDVLRSALVSGRAVDLDYLTVGPRAGTIVRVSQT
jgi:hypothetical protein